MPNSGRQEAQEGGVQLGQWGAVRGGVRERLPQRAGDDDVLGWAGGVRAVEGWLLPQVGVARYI